MFYNSSTLEIVCDHGDSQCHTCQHKSVIESILTLGVTCKGGDIFKGDRHRLDKVIKIAGTFTLNNTLVERLYIEHLKENNIYYWRH